MRLRKWEYGNHLFQVEILPRKKRQQQKVKVSPLDPNTGQPLTKQQMTGSAVTQAYKYPLTGKDEAYIRKHLFPDAAKKMLSIMEDRGILSVETSADDLASLLTEYRDDFIVTQALANHWNEKTQTSYRNQLGYVIPLLKGIYPADLTQEDYIHIQEQICRQASATSDKFKNWEPGEPIPTSGETRTRLLYLYLWYLLYSGLCDLQVIPTLYGGEANYRDRLLSRLARVRSFPEPLLQGLRTLFGDDYQITLILECGLRLREARGLLWGNLHVLDSSQGAVYVLHIVGQTNVEGYFTDQGKTPAAHRPIVVPSDLGAKLVAKRDELELQTGRNLRYEPMCGYTENRRYLSTPEYRKTYVRHWEDKISAYLRQPENTALVRAEWKKALIPVDEKRKISYEQCLYDSLTPHALRRNYCTWLYAHSGLSSHELYHEMGHAQTNLALQNIPGGKTPHEEVLLCLHHYLSQPGSTLVYDADGNYNGTEVPACDVSLHLKAGQTLVLDAYPTEPCTTLSLDIPDCAKIEEQTTVTLPDYNYTDALRFIARKVSDTHPADKSHDCNSS